MDLRHDDDLPGRPVLRSIGRGLRTRCPACNDGPIFSGYLTVNDHCPACGEALHHHRADDAPPYFTITIVGHIVIGGLLLVERLYHPPVAYQLAFWLPVTVLLALLLMRPVKAALIGLQWANYMHGFDPHSVESAAEPDLRPSSR